MSRSFGGTSSDEIVTAASPITALPLTFAGWGYAASLATNGALLSVANNGAGSGFVLLAIQSSVPGVQMAIQNSGGSTASVSGTATLSTNTWFHAAGTIMSSTLAIFTNGGNKQTAASGGEVIDFSPNNAGIGFLQRAAAGSFFNGRLADEAMWNVVLSDAEIAALAKGVRPYTIRPTALVGYWPLDGLQSPEPDLSGFTRNGTVTGTSSTAGPPVAQFTPRWPQHSLMLPAAGLGWIVNRRNKLMVSKKRA